MKTTPLIPGNYYHIYNRGINSCNIFTKEDNYFHFLKLYAKYVTPIAESFAWVLMPNHFHFLVRVKENIAYRYSNANRSIDAVRFKELKWETCDLSACEAPDSVKIPNAEKHFSHLFNAYAQAFNKQESRHGSLFERPFKRKEINSHAYLKQLVLYIHCNPVHHGFCNHPYEYPWSSYHTLLSEDKTSIKRDDVLGWFGNKENFIAVHDDISQRKLMEHLTHELE